MTLEKLIIELQALTKIVGPQTLVLVTTYEKGGLNIIDSTDLSTVIQNGRRWEFSGNENEGQVAVILWAI